MIRFILFLILFYIIYKGLQFFLRYLTSSRKNNQDIYNKSKTKSKYENIEEAEFREIKPDDKKAKDEEKKE